jgi:mRNA interferase HigB
MALKYKESVTGDAIWPEILATPTWHPATGIPTRKLLIKRGDTWEPKTEIIGPGYRAAYVVPFWDHSPCSQNGSMLALDRTIQMCVIARNTLRAFWERYPAAEGSLKAWFSEATRANWQTMADIKRRYATASIIDDERVVFNVGGNKFRLVVKVWFPGRAVWIKFIGTHASYDQIDVRKL